MVDGAHLYGGFQISPYLAMRVFEAVTEITARNLDPTLSHTSDDACDLCRSAQAKEKTDDAPPADLPRHQWTA